MVRWLSYSLPALWLAAFPFRGKLRPGGFRKLFASITTKGHGTRTPETATTEGSSSFRVRGPRSAARVWLRNRPPESSFTALSSFGGVTETLGGSGGRLDSAGPPTALPEALAALKRFRETQPNLYQWVASGAPNLTHGKHVALFGESYKATRSRKATAPP